MFVVYKRSKTSKVLLGITTDHADRNDLIHDVETFLKEHHKAWGIEIYSTESINHNFCSRSLLASKTTEKILTIMPSPAYTSASLKPLIEF